MIQKQKKNLGDKVNKTNQKQRRILAHRQQCMCTTKLLLKSCGFSSLESTAPHVLKETLPSGFLFIFPCLWMSLNCCHTRLQLSHFHGGCQGLSWKDKEVRVTLQIVVDLCQGQGKGRLFYKETSGIFGRFFRTACCCKIGHINCEPLSFIWSNAGTNKHSAIKSAKYSSELKQNQDFFFA